MFPPEHGAVPRNEHPSKNCHVLKYYSVIFEIFFYRLKYCISPVLSNTIQHKGFIGENVIRRDVPQVIDTYAQEVLTVGRSIQGLLKKINTIDAWIISVILGVAIHQTP